MTSVRDTLYVTSVRDTLYVTSVRVRGMCHVTEPQGCTVADVPGNECVFELPVISPVSPWQPWGGGTHGSHIWPLSRPDFHQTGQIWDFLTPVPLHFGELTEAKKSHICPI